MSLEKNSSSAAIVIHYAAPGPLVSADDPSAIALAEFCKNTSIEYLPASTDISCIDTQMLAGKSKIIIAYPSLYQTIKLSLTQEACTKEVTRSWVSLASKLLHLFRENRTKITLIEVSGMHNNLKDWLSSLVSFTGNNQLAGYLPSLQNMPDQPLTALHVLYAKQQAPVAQKLIQELEACSIPVQSNLSASDTLDLAPAVDYLRTSRPHADTHLTGILQEQFSVALAKLTSAEDLIREKESEAINLREEILKLRRSVESLQFSHDKKKTNIADLEHKLQAIKASSSWRITAPIRGFVRSMRRLTTTGRSTPSQTP